MTQQVDLDAPVPPPVRPPAAEPPVAAPRRPILSIRSGPIRSLVPRTLAGQFVAGVVLLVMAVVVVTSVATYLLLEPSLYKRLDQQADAVASQNATNLTGCLRRGNDRCGFGPMLPGGVVAQAPQPEWIAGFGDDGELVVSVANSVSGLNQLNLGSSDVTAILRNPGRNITVYTTDGRELRIAAQTLQTPAGTWTLVTGLSTEDVHRTLQRLLLLETAVGAVVLVLAAGFTGWGVRRGLRPLHRVTRTAQEVTAELGPDGAGLERRVPDADPTTEVGQVASSVNTLLGAVQSEFAARLRSEDRMRQFLADASHELRTPLTSIRGYAELSRLQGQSTDSSDDPMRRIETEGTRMSRLVEDLLVLARGDQDTVLQNEPVDVDALITEAAGAAHAGHPEREISVIRSGGAVVIGDRYQLLRVLLNLLNNAAVHTQSGPIRVEGVQGSTTDGGRAVALRVIDSGPGLEPEEAAHVFERFWRADKARTRARGGSGLGLAIVAQIVEAHGGRVSFDTSVDTGTTVTVTLPMAPVAGAAESTHALA